MKRFALFFGIAILASFASHSFAIASDEPRLPDPRDYAKIAEETVRDVPNGIRILALGEPTHGSDAFQLSRLEIAKAWIQKRGVRRILVENIWGAASVVNETITDGRCDDPVLKDPYPLWDYAWPGRYSTELMQWVCRWNRVHPSKRVTFEGFDVQYPKEHTREWLSAQLDAGPFLDPKSDETLRRALQVCAFDVLRTRAPSETEIAAEKECGTLLVPFEDMMEKKRTGFERKLGARKALTLFSSVYTLQYWAFYATYKFDYTSRGIDSKFDDARDLGMFRVTRWMLDDRRREPVLMFMHNMHVAPPREFQTIGGHLKKLYGPKYFRVAHLARSIQGSGWAKEYDRDVPESCERCLEFQLIAPDQRPTWTLSTDSRLRRQVPAYDFWRTQATLRFPHEYEAVITLDYSPPADMKIPPKAWTKKRGSKEFGRF